MERLQFEEMTVIEAGNFSFRVRVAKVYALQVGLPYF